MWQSVGLQSNQKYNVIIAALKLAGGRNGIKERQQFEAGDALSLGFLQVVPAYVP